MTGQAEVCFFQSEKGSIPVSMRIVTGDAGYFPIGKRKAGYLHRGNNIHFMFRRSYAAQVAIQAEAR